MLPAQTGSDEGVVDDIDAPVRIHISVEVIFASVIEITTAFGACLQSNRMAAPIRLSADLRSQEGDEIAILVIFRREDVVVLSLADFRSRKNAK